MTYSQGRNRAWRGSSARCSDSVSMHCFLLGRPCRSGCIVRVPGSSAKCRNPPGPGAQPLVGPADWRLQEILACPRRRQPPLVSQNTPPGPAYPLGFARVFSWPWTTGVSSRIRHPTSTALGQARDPATGRRARAVCIGDRCSSRRSSMVVVHETMHRQSLR